MDAENMTYEQKKEMAGKCNFMLISLFCTAAFICGLYSTGWCDFVERNITLVADYANAAEACAAAGLDTATCTAFADNHAVGFYSWQGTIPVENQVVCLSYTQPVAGVGYVEVSICCLFCFTVLLSFVLRYTNK